MKFLAVAWVVLLASVSAHSPLGLPEDQLPKSWADTVRHETHHRRVSDAVELLRRSESESLVRADEVAIQVRAASNSSCSMCQRVVRPLLDILDGSQGNVTVLLQDVCALKFKGTELDICRVAAWVIVEAGHILVHELNHYHWPVTTMVCSDVLSFCVWECCSRSTTPEQLQISFASRQVVAPTTSMRVSWVTLRPTLGAAVNWRVASTPASWQAAPESTRTYTKGGWVGISHSAVMSGLAAGTSYEYRVGSDATGWSETAVFQTLPLNAGSTARPLRVLGIADMGFGPNSDATAVSLRRQVAAGKVDFILHYGDIGYADGAEAGWDEYFRKMESITRVVPYMVGPGNHELLWNFTAYKARMWMPSPGDGAPSDGLYYRFDAGPVTFIMADSESFINTPQFKPPQLRWLRKQLQDANNSGQLIHVTHHRPLYCSIRSADCTIFASLLQDTVEALYDTHRVALASFGHIHSYERSHPMRFGKVAGQLPNTTAPVYCVNGAAGNREGQSQKWTAEKPAWSAVRTDDVGYAMVEYSRKAGTRVTTTTQRFLQSGTDAVADEFMIIKDLS